MDTNPIREVCYNWLGENQPAATTGDNAGDFRRAIVGAGPPTVAPASGAMELTLEATDELQVACLYFGDVLPWLVSRLVRIEIVLEITTVLTAVEQLIFGVSSARNNDPDALAASALFRIDGDAASNKIKAETDDGVNDVAPVLSGQVLAINTPQRFSINIADEVHSQAWPARNLGRGSNVKFYSTLGAQNKMKVGLNEKTHYRLDGYAGRLQPIVQLKKASGTTVSKVKVHEVKPVFQLPV